MKFLFLALALVSLCSWPSLPQQKTKDQPEIEAAKKFSAAFLRHLEETKDVSLLLDQYFASNPKRFFPYSFEDLLVKSDRAANLSKEDRDRIGRKLFNFLYVMVRYISNPSVEEGSDPSKRFPPAALQIVKRSPALSALLREGDDWNWQSDDLGHLNLFIEALDPVTVAMREYLSANLKEWKPYFEKNRSEFSASNDYDDNSSCKGEECFGLPEGTEVFTMNAYPFYLVLIKDGGSFKIWALDVITV